MKSLTVDWIVNVLLKAGEGSAGRNWALYSEQDHSFLGIRLLYRSVSIETTTLQHHREVFKSTYRRVCRNVLTEWSAGSGLVGLRELLRSGLYRGSQRSIGEVQVETISRCWKTMFRRSVWKYLPKRLPVVCRQCMFCWIGERKGTVEKWPIYR